MKSFRYQAPELYLLHNVIENPISRKLILHTHTDAELYCFLDGKATHYVEGTAYPLQPGDIILVRPMEAHNVRIDPSAPYERILLNFNAGILSSIDPDNRLMAPFFQRPSGKRNLYRPENDRCLTLLQNMTTPSSDQKFVILGNLILLLQQLRQMFCSEQRIIKRPVTQVFRRIGSDVRIACRAGLWYHNCKSSYDTDLLPFPSPALPGTGEYGYIIPSERMTCYA